ncbi:MAG: flagellar biosynthetic protein FliQ [Candidatus Tyrphobacter sp.]
MDAFDALLREMLVVTAILALPVVAVAAAVGAGVAILQAATQVQEQTVTLLPKMLAVGAVVALFGSLALRLCEHLFTDALAAVPALVRG